MTTFQDGEYDRLMDERQDGMEGVVVAGERVGVVNGQPRPSKGAVP